MRNIHNFNLISTFLCLWLAVYLSEVIESYLALVLILSVGLLHGANDIKIIKKVSNRKQISYYKTLAFYIGIVLLGTSMFYFIPKITLALFILLSGYHFGEQHFHEIKSNNYNIKRLLFISYGSSIIFLLLLNNSDESIEVIRQISNVDISKNMFLAALIISFVLFIPCFIFLVKKIKQPVREIFNLLVFFVVFKIASLIWAFAIYFVLWHSLPSLYDQVKFLSQDFNKKGVFQYVKSSFIYWLVSVIGLFVAVNFLVEESDSFYAIFFSFLAAITFPHVVVMTKIFKH